MGTDELNRVNNGVASAESDKSVVEIILETEAAAGKDVGILDEDVMESEVVIAVGGGCSTDAVVSCGETSVVDDIDDDATVASNAVVAKEVSPAMVVSDLGTCVHLLPSIVVIVNPAGRFALVDIVKKS